MDYYHPNHRARHYAKRATVILEADDGTALAYELTGDTAWLTADTIWTDLVDPDIHLFEDRIRPVMKMGGSKLTIQVEAIQKIDATKPWLVVKALSRFPQLEADREFDERDFGRTIETQ